jgi:hypothetical protein
VKDCSRWYEFRRVAVTHGTQRSHQRHSGPVLTQVLRSVGPFPRPSIPLTMGGSRAIHGAKALRVKRFRDSGSKDTHLRHGTHLPGESMIARDAEIIRSR